MAFKAIVCILCIAVINGITGKSLPSYIKPCKRNEPNFNECVRRMIENLRPFASRGIPEMHILPLDPMSVPSVTLNQGTGSMNFKALFTDLKGFGAKSYQIHNLRVDIKNLSMELDLNIPLFRIESKYDVDGKILLVPIQGKGKFVGNFTNASAKIKVVLKVVEKMNIPFFIIGDQKVNLTFDAVKVHFSNLFNGNKELGDQTNRFINENWKDLVHEIRPLIENTVASIVMGIIKPVLETYSTNELFPV